MNISTGAQTYPVRNAIVEILRQAFHERPTCHAHCGQPFLRVSAGASSKYLQFVVSRLKPSIQRYSISTKRTNLSEPYKNNSLIILYMYISTLRTFNTVRIEDVDRVQTQ